MFERVGFAVIAAAAIAIAACKGGGGGEQGCPAGQLSCDGACVDTSTDPANCDGCGKLCAFDHAQAACVGGVCQIAACAANWEDCDADSANGCEADLGGDPSHCGSCENACPTVLHGTAGCASANCVIGACDANWGDCDADVTTGCETDLLSDAANCGQCSNACVTQNGDVACAAGACTILSCNTPWADCDGAAATGCETNTSTSVSHCGACGRQCSLAHAVATCGGGSCVVQSCEAGFYDIDSNPANGCEYACTFVSANDPPDDGFVDANCDGIDGEATHAVFVAPTGSDSNAGTPNAPVATIGWALQLAQTTGRVALYVAAGSYSENVTLVGGISIHGGYSMDAGRWTRDGTKAVVTGSAAGTLRANNVTTSTIVEYLELWSASAVSPGGSSQVAVITQSPDVVLRHVVLRAGSGADGASGSSSFSPGASGLDGQKGEDGFEDDPSVFCSNAYRDPAPYTAAGTGSCGNSGGRGGRGCLATTTGSGCAGVDGGGGYGVGVGVGAGGTGVVGGAGNPGMSGSQGAAGASGVGGSGGVIVSSQWVSADGGDGTAGHAGGGGGGGAGGGSTHAFGACYDWGGSGGGGGGGGCGGGAGMGGKGGGASIGILLVGGSLTTNDVAIFTAAGGTGGAGGSRSKGGGGGKGGLGGLGNDEGRPGGAGGGGGPGGDGGYGGGGAGGPSACIVLASGATHSATALTCSFGTPGQGGNSFNPGVTGAAAQTLTL